MFEYLVVFLFGAGLGCAELLGRYRDAPFGTLFLWASGGYLLINGLIAVVSLFFLHTIATGLVPEGNELEREIYEVLIAGFGGAAFFRTAILRSRIGDTDIGIGPSFVIESLLAVTDRAVDRLRAKVRAQRIAPLMIDVPAAFVTDALSPYCVKLMQNLSAQEKEDIETEIAAMMAKEIDADVKPIILGLMLVNVVGLDALAIAKTSLKPLLDKKRKESAAIGTEAALAAKIAAQMKGARPARVKPATSVAAAGAATNRPRRANPGKGRN